MLSSIFVYGDQMIELYSKNGRTNVKYIGPIASGLFDVNILIIIPNCLIARLSIKINVLVLIHRPCTFYQYRLILILLNIKLYEDKKVEFSPSTHNETDFI